MGTAARVRLSEGFPHAYAVEIPFLLFLLGRLKLFIVLLFVVSAAFFSLSAKFRPEGRWAVMQATNLNLIAHLEPRIHLTAIEAIFTDSNRDVLEREFLSRNDAVSTPQLAVSVAATGASVGDAPASNSYNQEGPAGSMNLESRFPPPTVLPNGDLMFSSAWNNGQTAQLPNDEMVMPTLIPGDGFTEPADTNLPAIGDPAAAGYDAKAIARWDVVPFQTFDGKFNVGVVAFHMNGIEKVSFSVNDGPWEDVYQMTLNPQTANHSGIGNASDGVVEYWATLDASLFQADGAVEVRAIAYPTVGKPRVLEGLSLYTNGNGTLNSRRVYVSLNGDDVAAGTQEAPLRTIHKAIRTIRPNGGANGGQIVLMDEGFYELPYYSTGNDGATTTTLNDRWLTISSALDLDRNAVILGRTEVSRTVRMRVTNLKFELVSIDFTSMNQFYVGPTDGIWFDKVRWFSTNAGATQTNYPVRSTTHSYVTNSDANDLLYGFVGLKGARNVTLTNVRGDSLASTMFVANAEVSAVSGSGGSEFHSDILQYSGNSDNVIVYGVHAFGLSSVQVFFLEPTIYSALGQLQETMDDAAFVNIDIDYVGDPGSPPYSQMLSRFNHVLFNNVKMPKQRLIPRTDIRANNQAWYSSNVVFENSVFYNTIGPIQGVTIR